MYLEKIHIENYKVIKELDIDLKPGVNLLIGDNGAGKTSVLEGIAVRLHQSNILSLFRQAARFGYLIVRILHGTE